MLPAELHTAICFTTPLRFNDCVHCADAGHRGLSGAGNEIICFIKIYTIYTQLIIIGGKPTKSDNSKIQIRLSPKLLFKAVRSAPSHQDIEQQQQQHQVLSGRPTSLGHC